MRRIRARGKRFGRVVVIRELRGGDNHRRVRVLCDCGTRKIVLLDNLQSGHTSSCGCRRREVSAATSRRHGLHKTPAWWSYRGMLTRVLNPNASNHHWYKHVQITPRWLGPRGFLNFVADLGERPAGTTLGRIGDANRYDKKHAQWQTPGQQGEARRQKSRLKKAA
jgi:hypothetical protein